MAILVVRQQQKKLIKLVCGGQVSFYGATKTKVHIFSFKLLH